MLIDMCMEPPSVICVVDDQADYRLIVQLLFNRFLPTYPVRFYEGGQALLTDLAQLKSRPGLVILDRHMPHMNGHQTLLALKLNPLYQLIPVIMMSAEASAEEVNHCYQAGVNSFVTKRADFDSMKDSFEGVCHYWLGLNQGPIETRGPLRHEEA